MFQKPCNIDKSIIYQSKKESCLKFQIKKILSLKLEQIIATLANSSDVSMFHMFLYIIVISTKHSHKLLGGSPRARAFMLIGRPDYTSLLAAGQKIGGA
jgi:hypothetical protein